MRSQYVGHLSRRLVCRRWGVGLDCVRCRLILGFLSPEEERRKVGQGGKVQAWFPPGGGGSMGFPLYFAQNLATVKVKSSTVGQFVPPISPGLYFHFPESERIGILDSQTPREEHKSCTNLQNATRNIPLNHKAARRRPHLPSDDTFRPSATRTHSRCAERRNPGGMLRRSAQLPFRESQAGNLAMGRGGRLPLAAAFLGGWASASNVQRWERHHVSRRLGSDGSIGWG
jgi:hypothetical protein